MQKSKKASLLAARQQIRCALHFFMPCKTMVRVSNVKLRFQNENNMEHLTFFSCGLCGLRQWLQKTLFVAETQQCCEKINSMHSTRRVPETSEQRIQKDETIISSRTHTHGSLDSPISLTSMCSDWGRRSEDPHGTSQGQLHRERLSCGNWTRNLRAARRMFLLLHAYYLSCTAKLLQWSHLRL